MSRSGKTVIVTGGAGFIGCNFVRYLLAHTDWRVVNVDKLTYAGNLASLEEVKRHPRYRFEKADIANQSRIKALFKRYQPFAVINLAAETHVDRSIDSPAEFIHTNLVGTYTMLAVALDYYGKLPAQRREAFRFLHVSTDEVYGSLGPMGLFNENTPYEPNSPYSASKAGADHLVRAYYGTYGLPCLITNCSNNYGPFQFPEKLIPLMILQALNGKPLPIYGDGGNVRDWLYVEDHCQGILLVLNQGKPGQKYNIGGRNERTNLEVVDMICRVLEKIKPAAQNQALVRRGLKTYEALKTFVEDRPGHDRRYAIDASKIMNELGWRSGHDFSSGIEATVSWYLAHLDWCEKVQKNNYGRERLGLKKKPRAQR